MTGRDAFEKYNEIINAFVWIAKKMPKRLRLMLLRHCRNRNGKLGMLERYIFTASLIKSIGKNVAIFPGVFFENIENLSIGNNVSIHQMCYIDSEGGIQIGNDVSIAHRCSILSSNHSYKDAKKPIKYQDMVLERTIIYDNVWIGCGSVILAGVEIGSGSVIGANSTVTRSIPENCVAVGTPAKKKKNRIEGIDMQK